MEDLVAFAFIGLLDGRKDESDLKISVRQLAEYKKNVLNALNHDNKTAIIPTSRDYLERLLFAYKDYFSYEENDKSAGFIILKGKTKEDLKNRFIAFIPIFLRTYFETKRNLEPILEGY